MRADADFYRDLLDSLSEGVFFVDLYGRITYWSEGARRLCGHGRADVMGIGCSDGILMCVDDQGVSLCDRSCPRVQALESGTARTVDVYLLHSEGYRLPVSIRIAPIRGSAGEIIGASGILRDNSASIADLSRAENLERVAYIDPITGLASRRFIEISLQARLDEMPRYGWTFALLLVGIDDFEALQVSRNPEIVANIVRMVSQTLVRGVRSFDVVGRWPDGQFVSIFVNVRHRHQLSSIAGRFRGLVAQSGLRVEEGSLRVTVSIGATLARPDDTVARLLNRADNLLSRRKTMGSNRVHLDSGSS